MAEKHHVVVDGSNLATEGRKTPSLAQLDEAVRAYAAEDPTAEIVVVVDASFDHRIDPSEREQLEEAQLHGEIVSPPAGAIGRGDAFVLRIAERTGAVVLSNDSFQEFHGEHPWLFDDGRLVGGKPVPGVGWIFTPRSPVRGPKSRQATGKAKRGAARDIELPAPAKAAELAKAVKKAAARRAATLPDGTTPQVGDVWPPAKAPAKKAGSKKGTGATSAAPAKKAAAMAEPAPKQATRKAKKAAKEAAPVKKAAKKAAPAKKAAKEAAPVKKAAKKTAKEVAKETAPAKKAAKKVAKEVAKETAPAKKAAKKVAKEAAPAKKAAPPARASGRRGRVDPTLTEAIKEATAEVLSPPVPTEARDGKAKHGTKDGHDTKEGKEKEKADGKAGKQRSKRRGPTTPPPAVNEPLDFITFVAAYPLGSEVEGEVVSFTSHGAMVAAKLPDGGSLDCYIPLTGLAVPAPTKARQVLSRGEVRTFVLVSLDPARRVAELALPGVAR